MPETKFFQKVARNSGKVRIQRQFLLILALLAVGFFAYGYFKLSFPLLKLIIGLAATLIAGITLYFLPVLLRPLLFVWLLLGMVIGEITSVIILGLIYYLLFFPITFILRKTRQKDAPDEPGWHSREKDIIDYKKLY